MTVDVAMINRTASMVELHRKSFDFARIGYGVFLIEDWNTVGGFDIAAVGFTVAFAWSDLVKGFLQRHFGA
jgi:hypothetical protein